MGSLSTSDEYYDSIFSNIDNDSVNEQCSKQVSFTDDYYEYESGSKQIIVKGRLSKNIDFWKSIGANDFIIETIRDGYKIPFYSLPESCKLKNNKSARDESQFVSEAILDLIKRVLVVKCETAPYIVNPLTVSVQSSGKKRLILDLRIVNQHLWKQSVKYDDTKIALSYFTKDCFMYKFDIHSAYHFIDIFPPHTEFLGFSWEDENGLRFYGKFLVIPFGLSTAPYIFTKVTRPLIAKWRSEGKCILMYLDDGFGCKKGFEACKNEANEVKLDLIASGFIPKVEKCIWYPVQVTQFLGNVFDAEKGLIYIPDSRITKTLNTIEGIFDSIHLHRRVHVKKVASFIGQVISMSLVLGHLSNIMTKFLSIDVASAISWTSYIKLSEDSKQQLLFWRDTLPKVNFRSVGFSPSCTKIVYSDAGSLAFGGYEVSTVNGVSHGMWSPEERCKSSTWRELMAVYRVLVSLIHILKGQRIKWFTDNKGVCSIIEKGSMNVELQKIALEIFKVCLFQGVKLEIDWIPRSLNEKADFLSRIEDKDDWGISFEILDMIQCKWGELKIDWFASDYNAKLPIFYSRYWNEHSTGIDAFSQFWGDEFGLFVPPINLIARVLEKMKLDRVHGVIVIPMWNSGNFMPLLWSGGKFCSFVVDWFELPTEKQFYVRCKNGKGLIGNVNLAFKMCALLIKF